jgi:hypothetical protein
MMMVTRAPAEGAGAGVVKAGAGVVPPRERGVGEKDKEGEIR